MKAYWTEPYREIISKRLQISKKTFHCNNLSDNIVTKAKWWHKAFNFQSHLLHSSLLWDELQFDLLIYLIGKRADSKKRAAVSLSLCHGLLSVCAAATLCKFMHHAPFWYLKWFRFLRFLSNKITIFNHCWLFKGFACNYGDMIKDSR